MKSRTMYALAQSMRAREKNMRFLFYLDHSQRRVVDFLHDLLSSSPVSQQQNVKTVFELSMYVTK